MGFWIRSEPGETRVRGDVKGLKLLREIIDGALAHGWAEIHDKDTDVRVKVECAADWTPPE